MVLAIIGAIFAASQAIAGGVASWMFRELMDQAAESPEHPPPVYVTYRCGKSSICKDVSCFTSTVRVKKSPTLRFSDIFPQTVGDF